MIVTDSFLDTVFVRVEEQPPLGFLRLTLSAKRDLVTKSLWGKAYSQVRKAARDNKLVHCDLDGERIAAVANAFRVDSKSLLTALVRCIPTYDATRAAVAEAIRSSGSIVALVGDPGPARDGVMLALLHEVGELLGASRLVRVLHSRAPARLNAKLLDSRHHLVLRQPGHAFVPLLREAIRSVQRMDADAVGFDAVDNAVVAREIGELIAGSRTSFVVADQEGLVREAMRYAGRSARSSRTAPCLSVGLMRDGIFLSEIRCEDEPRPRLFHSAPARSAAHLLDHGTLIEGSLIVNDELLSAAAQLTLDEIGKLSNAPIARTDILRVLRSEGVSADSADALARRLIDLMQTHDKQ